MLQRLKTPFFLFLLIGLLFLASPEVHAQGCSQCKMIPQSDLQNGGHIASGINKGILYMMALPYIILFLLFRKQIIGFYKQLRARK
ncbi:MAG: hypothetical protein ACHQRM_00075 [Bacteroidia bacterium]